MPYWLLDFRFYCYSGVGFKLVNMSLKKYLRKNKFFIWKTAENLFSPFIDSRGMRSRKLIKNLSILNPILIVSISLSHIGIIVGCRHIII